jgi:hypothetical protein
VFQHRYSSTAHICRHREGCVVRVATDIRGQIDMCVRSWTRGCLGRAVDADDALSHVILSNEIGSFLSAYSAFSRARFKTHNNHKTQTSNQSRVVMRCPYSDRTAQTCFGTLVDVRPASRPMCVGPMRKNWPSCLIWPVSFTASLVQSTAYSTVQLDSAGAISCDRCDQLAWVCDTLATSVLSADGSSLQVAHECCAFKSLQVI